MADEPSGFLGRWARRKADAREGKPLPEPPRPVKAVELAPRVEPEPASAVAVPQAEPQHEEAPVPSLTLDDARKLNKDSDFTPFMARKVEPEVRNAAMKKLFADPHFNVMDGLDTYIDDYSKPDPLPLAMLRQMASAKFLNLFEEDPPSPAAIDQSVAQSSPLPPAPPTDHAHTHLRLQPDDAPPAQSAGSGSA
ncbi:MAG TPA: DUF3306 domain-containing protein [Rhodoferax sp.]|nr:DUF3306 domain-containing protein [Rhodoferax sp.]